MALRISKEPGKGEKAFWIGISFFLMFVKMWAIGHDRHVQDVKYQDEANQRQTQFDATVDRLKSIDVHVIDIPASNAHVDWSVLLQSKPHIPQVSEAER
jgi:GH25 family lysozyme M1 (1,4-beta-N-acetylmuramidase)